MQEKTYNSIQAAMRLGITQSTVVRWCQAGRFPGAYLRLGSRKLGWVIPESALRAIEGGNGNGVGPLTVSRQLAGDK